MPFSSPASLRGRIAATRRHHPETDVTDLKREHAAAKIAAYVEKTVAEAPPLTDEQRDRLAALMRGVAA